MKLATLILAIVLLAPSGAPAADLRRTPVVLAVERVSPAVVNISTEQVIERRLSPFGGFLSDPFFERFFEEFELPEFRQSFKSTSLGSGFIVDDEGRVLTNAHVVRRASKIRITLADKRSFSAELIASDPDSDVAVLKITEGSGLPHVTMGTSDDLMVGETVITIGNPFGLSHTVTTGVISATRRSFKGNGAEYRDFIQTDASINPGNSGGPLVNIHGEVIGVNTAIIQAAEGIGFAIPIRKARRILGDLLKYGKVQAVWIGAEVQTINAELAAALGTAGRPGVVVTRVEPDSPAGRAGLRQRDVITRFGGRSIEDKESFRAAVEDVARETPQSLEGLREGSPFNIAVTLTAPPPDYADRLLERNLGLKLKPGGHGVLIDSVRDGSPADKAGLERGDRIVVLGEERVASLADARRAVLEARKRGRLRVSVRRGNATASFIFPLE